jgi:hypothetical protein
MAASGLEQQKAQAEAESERQHEEWRKNHKGMSVDDLAREAAEMQH